MHDAAVHSIDASSPAEETLVMGVPGRWRQGGLGIAGGVGYTTDSPGLDLRFATIPGCG